jgi:hypothetical protein
MRRPTRYRSNDGKKNLQTQCLAEKYRETEQFLAQVRLRLVQQKTPENLTQHFEEGLRDAFARDARSIVEELFNDRQLVPDDTLPLPGEVVHSARPVNVQTLFGSIVLKRRYLYHPNSHNGRAPLDLSLDLVGRHTPAVAKLICLASANSASYHEAGETLNAFTGLHLDERSHHRLVNRLAPDLREAVGTLQPPASLKPIPVLYVENDGTGVPSRAKELAGRPGKQPDGTAKTREAKLGCVFTQTSTDKDGAPMRDPDSTSYVGTMGDCRESGKLLRAEAIRRGLALAQTTVFLGDGAAWIWENARLYFPTAIQILDFYHAVEHLGVLVKTLYGDSEFSTAQQSVWASELKRSDALGIIAQAEGLLESLPDLDQEKQDIVRREIAYFTTHAERTRYGYFREQGYFIGSGVIEAGCKSVIGARLKQSGMFWSGSGAENILGLRCLIKSPHFQAAWQARRPIIAARQSKARRWKAAS